MMKEQHLYIYIYLTEPELTLMTKGCKTLGISYLPGEYATQLATRLYLVEKYLNAYDARSGSGTSDRVSSPGVIAPILDKYDSSNGSNVSEQDLAAEREDIVKSLLILLGQVDEISTETLGNAFLSEISRIARVLLDAPPARKGNLAQASESYLRSSVAVVEKLDLISPTGNTRKQTRPIASDPFRRGKRRET